MRRLWCTTEHVNDLRWGSLTMDRTDDTVSELVPFAATFCRFYASNHIIHPNATLCSRQCTLFKLTARALSQALWTGKAHMQKKTPCLPCLRARWSSHETQWKPRVRSQIMGICLVCTAWTHGRKQFLALFCLEYRCSWCTIWSKRPNKLVPKCCKGWQQKGFFAWQCRSHTCHFPSVFPQPRTAIPAMSLLHARWDLNICTL